MKVNRNNYEVWIIDYFDGKLNAAEVVELMAFLKIHPDLKEEFDLFDTTPIEKEEAFFAKKSDLKKTPITAFGEITEENYTDYFIAHCEKDLSAAQTKNLDAFLGKNPQLEKEFKLHGLLVLQADKSITYEHKETLRKKSRIGVYWWSTAAAALIIFLVGLFSLLQEKVVLPETETNFYVINRLDAKENISKISVAENKLNLPERSLSKIDLSELVLHTEDITVERSSIGKMPVMNTETALATDPPPPFLLPDFEDPDVLYALAENTPVTEKRKSALGRIIKNFGKQISESVTVDNSKQKNKKDPTFVKVLDQSILVFNTLTGSDTELVKSYDEDGNLKHYEVDGETLSWSKNISIGSPNAE